MRDPYLYAGTDILRNLAGLKTEELNEMEADYTSYRLSELVMDNYTGIFDVEELCRTHYIIFQDIFEWAGKFRTINIEKPEPALGGISIEYTDYSEIKADLVRILDSGTQYLWREERFEESVSQFSDFMAKLWKVHPFREGNTRTIVTFCCRFIESFGIYVDSGLFKDNARYMRTALVAASAVFTDLGDRRKAEYLENIVSEALANGLEMKKEIKKAIKLAGMDCSEDTIREIILWNRAEHRIHNHNEIIKYFKG